MFSVSMRSDIYFIGSGSEANNLAIKGLAEKHVAEHSSSKGHIVCSAVEHPSVLETVRYLEGQGLDVTWLGVRADGTLSAQAVADAFAQ